MTQRPLSAHSFVMLRKGERMREKDTNRPVGLGCDGQVAQARAIKTPSLNIHAIHESAHAEFLTPRKILILLLLFEV